MRMSVSLVRARSFLVGLWRSSAPLSAVAGLMLPVLLACLLGLWLDPRSIAGAPAWLKPAKFAGSIALYSLTLAWVFQYLPDHPRLQRRVGWLSAVVFLIEISIIIVQAARGQRSHFNTGTLIDGALFTIMGVSIVLQTLGSVAVAVALWGQKLADPALGWSLRLGLAIAILAASIGGLMTRPTPQQVVGMRVGPPSVVGAHTVGAPDGGPGLPATGWSREHGDLRVPHFFGLHALQALPLLALGVRRRRWSDSQRTRLVVAAGGSYGGLVVLLLWQALRGQALLAPDGITAGALLVWLALSLVLGWRALGGVRRQAAHAL
jgi:hypothetical protein